MIKNFDNFINESFTSTIRSIKGFLDKVNIKNSEYFIDDLNYFCHDYDIPLSKIFGDYLNTRKTLKLLKMTNKQLAVFRFNLESYIGFFIYDGNLFEKYFEDVDYCIVVDIDAQEKGLKELRRKRAILTDDIPPLKNDAYWKTKNLERYRRILDERRLPGIIKRIVEEIIKNNNINDIPGIASNLKGWIPNDLYTGIINMLYDYRVLPEHEYYRLSSNYYN